MKNHIYHLNLCIHTISIHVSFPCTVGASLQIDNQQLQITDNIDIKDAQQSINATTQTEVSLLFNPRTAAYSMKKAVINFFLKTKSGKLQAGSTAIFLNKSLEGCTNEIAKISKCSDRQATVQYSMHLQLVEETDTNMTASMFKGSQVSSDFNLNNNSMRNSSVSYTRRFFNENTNLYESIVQEVDDKTDQAWEKGSNGSKGSAGNQSFISDLKHINSTKNINSWRNQSSNETNFRKSRLEGSSVGQHRKSTSTYNNNNSNSNSSFMNTSTYKLSTSRAGYPSTTPPLAQQTLTILQKKTTELQQQNKQLKDTITTTRQELEQQLSQQKKQVKKSQILQSSMREELQLMKQKYASLEQQASGMRYEKNQLLNRYNRTENDNIAQVKAKEKSMAAENKRLSQKIEKLEKSLSQQQEKVKSLQLKMKDQQLAFNKKIKQYEYYQKEAMQLDEKLSELRLVEEQLNKQIEKLTDEMAKKDEEHEKDLAKYKKEFSSIKEVKEQETKGLGKEMSDLRTRVREKEAEVVKMGKEFEAEKKKLAQQLTTTKAGKEKQEKEVTRLKEELTNQQEESSKLQQVVSYLEDKLKSLQEEMQHLTQNRDQCLTEMEIKLQQLNMQEFRLNEQNFQLEERLALMDKALKQRQEQSSQLINNLQQSKLLAQQQQSTITQLHQQLQQTLEANDSLQQLNKQQKQQLSLKQQSLLILEQKMLTSTQQLQHSMSHLSQLQKHNLELENELKESNKLAADLERKLSEMENQGSEVEKQRGEQIVTLQEECRLKIKQKNGEIQVLTNKYEELENELDRVSTLHSELTLQNNTIISQLQKANTELQHIKTTVQSLEQQLQQKQLTIEENNQRITTLEGQLKTINQEHKKSKQSLQSQSAYLMDIEACVQLFQQLFTATLNKDYESIVLTPKKPTPYKYASNSTNNSKKQPLNDSRKLLEFSTKKNIQFAQTLSQNLQQMESCLLSLAEKNYQLNLESIKTHKQLDDLRGDLQRKQQEIISLTTQVSQFQSESAQNTKKLTLYSRQQQKTTRQALSTTNKLKELQSTIQKHKTIIDDLRKDLATKTKEIVTLKSTISTKQQVLKETEIGYKQSKDKMEIEVNLQLNQLKSQLIEQEKLVSAEREVTKKKDVRISELEAIMEAMKTDNGKVANEAKKEALETKRQLTMTKKDLEKKNLETQKLTNQLTQLNKKIETLTTSNRDNLQKFQKANQQLLTKNKQISELQVTIRDKVTQISKTNLRVKQLQQESAKSKKQQQDMNKALISQQQINSKNLITIKEQKELIQKKEEIFKETQKELKQLEGQLFNQQKRVKTQQQNVDDSVEVGSSMSSSTYSYKKLQQKKQVEGNNFSPSVSAFSSPSYNPYAKKNSVYGNNGNNSNLSEAEKQLRDQIRSLKEETVVKDKTISQLEQKLNKLSITTNSQTSTKTSKYTTPSKPQQSNFTKTTSTLLPQSTSPNSMISKSQQQLKQQILQNLQSIQALLSNPQTGNRFDKYKVQLSSLINKNKKFVLQGSPFQQMRKLSIVVHKAKTMVQNKLKIQNQVKNLVLEEFAKVQAIVDQVMGK